MEGHMFDTFRRMACSLTADQQLQRDLMQEMFVHLLDVRVNQPGLPQQDYIRSSEQHARSYFMRLRAGESTAGVLDMEEPRDEWITPEQVETIRPRLSARQQAVLEHLQKGCGVRETARRLGISHPAVIKHRNKITRALHELVHAGSLDEQAVAAAH